MVVPILAIAAVLIGDWVLASLLDGTWTHFAGKSDPDKSVFPKIDSALEVSVSLWLVGFMLGLLFGSALIVSVENTGEKQGIWFKK